MDRPPLPPFNAETAVQKVRLAEDLWNTRDPARVVLAYSPLHWLPAGLSVMTTAATGSGWPMEKSR
jgi:nuclear transport factor 2 (NTF2) superfamily protein